MPARCRYQSIELSSDYLICSLFCIVMVVGAWGLLVEREMPAWTLGDGAGAGLGATWGPVTHGTDAQLSVTAVLGREMGIKGGGRPLA